MTSYRADLHVHTVLSPCAQVEMIPPLIVRTALENKIDLIAITDHNATANIVAVQRAARDTKLTVLPGMEIQTREEVHSLCLFDTLEQAQAMQNLVDRHLPNMANNPDIFGEQFVVDETGDFLRSEPRLLINSVDLSLKAAWEAVERLGGLFIPAHVNRHGFGLIRSLGLVPTDVPLAALEISRHLGVSEAAKTYPQLTGYPLIQSGDVHGLDEFLGSSVFRIKKPAIEELKLAIREEKGRSLHISIP